MTMRPASPTSRLSGLRSLCVIAAAARGSRGAVEQVLGEAAAGLPRRACGWRCRQLAQGLAADPLHDQREPAVDHVGRGRARCTIAGVVQRARARRTRRAGPPRRFGGELRATLSARVRPVGEVAGGVDHGQAALAEAGSSDLVVGADAGAAGRGCRGRARAAGAGTAGIGGLGRRARARMTSRTAAMASARVGKRSAGRSATMRCYGLVEATAAMRWREVAQPARHDPCAPTGGRGSWSNSGLPGESSRARIAPRLNWSEAGDALENAW
jgi:hypothetical protein